MSELHRDLEGVYDAVRETAVAAVTSGLGWSATVDCIPDDLAERLVDDIDRAFASPEQNGIPINTGDHKIIRLTPLWFNGFLGVADSEGAIEQTYRTVEGAMTQVFKTLPLYCGRSVFLNKTKPGAKSPFHEDEDIRWSAVVAPDEFGVKLVEVDGEVKGIDAKSGVVVIRGNSFDRLRLSKRAVKHQFTNPRPDSPRHSMAVALS